MFAIFRSFASLVLRREKWTEEGKRDKEGKMDITE